jgi:hypothetical protein
MRKLLVFTLSILFTYNCAVTANAGKMTVTDTTAKKTLGENIIVEESTVVVLHFHFGYQISAMIILHRQ